MNHRIEHDSMGVVKVPSDALYAAQTQRAVDNFRFSGRRMPAGFIRSLALIKVAAAQANAALGQIDADIADRIVIHGLAVAGGAHSEQFPVDVFQTGSGTSTNMNMNEVLATLAGSDVHPNDHVNRSQSSNDVIPCCIQVSSALAIEQELLPALDRFGTALSNKANELDPIVKTGRTHLMDALPLTFGQEIGTWAFQIQESAARIVDLLPRLKALPLGGTAIGTGVNCPAGFAEAAVQELVASTGVSFTVATNRFSRIAGQDVAVECSSALKSLAIVLMKVANDIRWMSSGPLAGLAEIELTALQPGSSIMPGKVNPVLPEAVAMIAAEVIGNDVSVSVAAQSGNFQLNVMLPLIAEKLLTGIDLLAAASDALGATVTGFKVNTANIDRSLSRNPILVTALNERIGYEAAAAIAREAYASGRPVIDVAVEETGIERAQLEQLLDPARLARPDS